MPLINFSGIASGIDSASLIEALLDQQRTTRIVPLETNITQLQDTNSALEELTTLLDNLKTTAEGFRSLNGGALAKTASSSNETSVTAIASNSAATGTYDINVTQTAENATFSFDDRFADGSDAINSSINDGASAADRTVSYTVGTGADAESIDIELTSSTTAAEFVNEFNSQSSKATASLVNVGTTSSPSYAVVINSGSVGTEDGTITLDSVGSEITSAGSGAFTSNQLNQATDLQFTLSGIAGTITRSSNTVSDVISGLSFTAQDTGTSTITVGVDGAATQSIVEEFVDGYNEILNFINENDTVVRDDSGEEVTNIFGPLASTSLDQNVLTAIRTSFSEAGISGGSVNILADLGITTERDGTLSFDSETFNEALAAEPQSVQTILENLGEELGSVDGTIAQFTRFSGLIDQSIEANSGQISSYQDQVSSLEDAISNQEQSLTAQYARLEAQIGQLQSQQNALVSLLP